MVVIAKLDSSFSQGAPGYSRETPSAAAWEACVSHDTARRQHIQTQMHTHTAETDTHDTDSATSNVFVKSISQSKSSKATHAAKKSLSQHTDTGAANPASRSDAGLAGG